MQFYKHIVWVIGYGAILANCKYAELVEMGKTLQILNKNLDIHTQTSVEARYYYDKRYMRLNRHMWSQYDLER